LPPIFIQTKKTYFLTQYFKTDHLLVVLLNYTLYCTL